MAFESITHKLRGAGRRKGSGAHPAMLTITGRKAPLVNGNPISPARLLFRIVPDLWKAAEFEPGEKVEVYFDKARGLGMIALSAAGYALTFSAVQRGEPDVHFSIPHDESTGFPFYPQQTGMEDVEVKEGAVYFRVVVPGDPAFASVAQSHQGNGEHQKAIKGKKRTETA